jgi:hypothetical protein
MVERFSNGLQPSVPLLLEKNMVCLIISQSGVLFRVAEVGYLRMSGPNWAQGQSSDLVQIKRELYFSSLNSPQSYYTIIQTVSSSLINLIQQLDVNLISEAII